MNYDQNEENDENNENNDQAPKFDPAGETKQKIIFFVIAIILVIIVKMAMGL